MSDPAPADVVVVPGGAEDVEAVVALWVELAAGQRAHGSHLLAGENRDQIRQSAVRHAVTGGLLLARQGDPTAALGPDADSAPAPTVAGFVMFSREVGAFEQDVTRGVVENLYVRPERRGEGVGTALLAAAEDALAARGADVVALEAMAGNRAARRFYERRGYRVHRVELERELR